MTKQIRGIHYTGAAASRSPPSSPLTPKQKQIMRAEKKRRREAMKDRLELTSDIKQQLADVVRSVHLTTPVVGGMCLWRAVCGQVALAALGHQADLMFGGVMYPAAPGDINVLSMGGPGGIGMIQDAMLFGHVWLVLPTATGKDLIDFSVGDWREQSDACTRAYYSEVPLIDWQVEPPQYVWDRLDRLYVDAPLLEFDELTLGKPRYCPFHWDQAALLKSLQPVWVEDLKAVAAPLLNSVRHFAAELR